VASQDRPTADATGFGPYLFAHGAWFLAFGVQVVLFPYLVRVVLHESAIRFGLAQMCLQLPTTLLILFGGALADRADNRRIMTLCCALAAAGFLCLGLLVVGGRLTYGLMIGYALSIGAMGAFAMPARDSLLSQVAPERGAGSLQGAVAFASLAQFGGQILGMVCATAAALIGVGALLLGQAGLMVVATVATLGIRPRPRAARDQAPVGGVMGRLFSDIAGGFAAVTASPVMAAVTLCAAAMGICFMGSFAVLLPMIVQGYFPHVAGGHTARIASALGLFSLCFWTGSMISALVLMRVGPRLRHRGRVYLIALALGALVLMLCALRVPLWLLCAINFVWGLCGGVAMTLGRGLIQQHAPEASRARVLSVFNLGMMGGGPVGALADGFLAQAVGPHAAILVPSGLMLLLVAGVVIFTRLGREADLVAAT
jgi:MFS family permease